MTRPAPTVSTSAREVLRMFLDAHATEDRALYGLALELAGRLTAPGAPGAKPACPNCGADATERIGARWYCGKDAAEMRAAIARAS